MHAISKFANIITHRYNVCELKRRGEAVFRGIRNSGISKFRFFVFTIYSKPLFSAFQLVNIEIYLFRYSVIPLFRIPRNTASLLVFCTAYCSSHFNFQLQLVQYNTIFISGINLVGISLEQDVQTLLPLYYYFNNNLYNILTRTCQHVSRGQLHVAP